MASISARPVTVALVDDYDVVVSGLAHMLAPYDDRVRIVELDANEPVRADVDIALYDSFAQPESDHHEVALLVANPRARRVVIYTWNFHPDLVVAAHDLGVHGYPPPVRAGLARSRRRPDRPRVRNPGPHHPGQKQR